MVNMTFDYLNEHYLEFINEVDKSGYGKKYCQTIKSVLYTVLDETQNRNWNSYYDIYDYYCSKGFSKSRLGVYASSIGLLREFEENHSLPLHGKRMNIAHKDKYTELPDEFKELIDYFERFHKAKGNSSNYIHCVGKIATFFLFSMMQRGCTHLAEITEEYIVSFFNGNYDGKSRGYGTAEFIRRIFKCGIEWKQEECSRILAYIPKFPKARKIIPYLKEEEISKLRCIVDDISSELSLRDRAICLMLIFTGLRRGDIAGMQLDDIDWEHSKIVITQQKTEQMVTIPMVTVLGNALYDYIKEERPQSTYKQVFLSYRYGGIIAPISGATISKVIKKISEKAEVRQNDGERIFPHLFRHNMATTMLENSVSQPVISNLLGHSSPSSVEHYLGADFVHLKECALSIEKYPVSKEVFDV